MTASDTVRQQRRTVGLTVGLLMVATLALGIACAAIGEEILTLPETRMEAAEIAARLPGLRAERDTLIEEVAKLRSELEGHRARVEQAEAVASEIQTLQAEERRARGERDRLTKEVIALTSDRDSLQAAVDSLAGRRKSFEAEVGDLVDRTAGERKRFDEVRQEVSEERKSLTQAKDALSAEKQKLAQAETELADTDRLLNSKRAELNGLTVEERNVRDQVARLREMRNEPRDRKPA